MGQERKLDEARPACNDLAAKIERLKVELAALASETGSGLALTS
jgi:outer membrane murein-binding lipoprotein Lpp